MSGTLEKNEKTGDGDEIDYEKVFNELRAKEKQQIKSLLSKASCTAIVSLASPPPSCLGTRFCKKAF